MALTTNLVAYYACDEASGNLIDALGSNNLTDHNSIGAASGRVNGGRDFEASSSQYASHADSATFSRGDTDFTIAAWFNLESAPDESTIVSKWDEGGADYEYSLFWFGGLKFFVQPNPGQFPAAAWGGSFSTGTWYHVVAWHDATNDELGIAVNDGTPVTQSHATGVRDGAADFAVGYCQGGASNRYFDGIIDEVGLWSRVLTSGERTALYNGGNGITYPFSTGGVRRAALTGGIRTLTGGIAG